MKTKQIKKILKTKSKKKKIYYLSTGSTLLNLALTGHPKRGFPTGKYHFIVGDSISGKTFLALTCLAEATLNPFFKDHRFIFDNSEDGALMDIRKFFGEKVLKRMKPPRKDKRGPIYSTTIEEFYFHLDDAIKDGRPFIYILDSMDSVSSKQEHEKFEETKKAYRKGKTTTGSYGDGKAKINSANVRRILSPLGKTDSILIIINQTRDNIGFGFEPKSRSGGHALRFYATSEIWSSVKNQITKAVKGHTEQLGRNIRIKVKKNRITGRERIIEIPIYHSLGIDDIGSCINYLIQMKHWKKKPSSSIIIAKDFDFEGNKNKLIRRIEKKGWEKDLIEIVTDVWNEVEEACKIKRKRRYE